MKKILLIVISLIIICGRAEAQFKISGKIRTLRPVSLLISNLEGKKIVGLDIISGVEFTSEPQNIVADYYIMQIGESKQMIFLENSPIRIKGFLDDKKPANSDLVFDGVAMNNLLKTALYDFKQSVKGGWNWNQVRDKYPATILAAIVYDNNEYFSTNYERLDSLYNSATSEEKRASVIVKLEEKMKQMKHFSLGAVTSKFSLPDKNGKIISNTDFSGKLVLLDFWASWCGPCRAEMKSLHKIYEEIKGEDLIFISISLDDDKEKWLQAMEADSIPWLALWDKDGFDKSQFKGQFGFNSIPFIALIGRDGKLISRNLRGEQVKAEIEKNRKNN